jgi:hypothetical protein
VGVGVGMGVGVGRAGWLQFNSTGVGVSLLVALVTLFCNFYATGGQCYKTFLRAQVAPLHNKLVCLSLASPSS